MEANKMQYLEESKIKVKNLLSDIYESESDVLKETKSVRDKSIKRLENLDHEYNTLINKHKELEEKYNRLRNADDSKWEKAKSEFELAIRFVEGDKESFIQKAENTIRGLSARISEIEPRIDNARGKFREKLEQSMEDLEYSRNEIQNRIDEIRKSSGDNWRDIKYWFLEKTRDMKDRIEKTT